jgi:hypothetical protein
VTYTQNQAYTRENNSNKKVDCLRTTIANLLHIHRDSVPHFVQDEHDGIEEVDIAVNKFLRPFGLAYLRLHLSDDYYEAYGITCLNYDRHGMSPRGVNHSCAYRDTELVHDPHPSHAGIDEADSTRGVFIALRPWDLVRLAFLDGNRNSLSVDPNPCQDSSDATTQGPAT